LHHSAKATLLTRATLTVTKAVSGSPWPRLTAQDIRLEEKAFLLLLIASFLLLMVRLGGKRSDDRGKEKMVDPTMIWQF
jgi:hypothetical protein